MKVKDKQEAWEWIGRIFDSVELDEEGSKRAGYNIYRHPSSRSWVSDLGDRLEVNEWSNQTNAQCKSWNIWLEDHETKDVTVVVGMYREKTVFGEVKATELQEVKYHYAVGLVINKTLDDGRPGIELTLADGSDSIASFGNESVAYIRFE